MRSADAVGLLLCHTPRRAPCVNLLAMTMKVKSVATSVAQRKRNEEDRRTSRVEAVQIKDAAKIAKA